MGHTVNAREIVELFKATDALGFDELCSRYGDDPRSGVQNAIAAARKRLAAEEQEQERIRQLYALQAQAGEGALVVGIDEVGRGSVAGPLTVAAVALPLSPMILGLNDSKKLTPAKREEVAARIRGIARAVSISHIPPEDIDACGMSASLRVAMTRALAGIGAEPDLVLIDGNPVHIHPKERCIVHGDAQVACIAAASIIAKVTRDALMVEQDALYPGYHFAESKGYASPEHIQAIKDLGLSPIHRVSFCQNFLQETLF